MNVLTAVLLSGEEPSLSRAQMQRVHRASIAHKAYADAHPGSDDDEGPEDDDAWLYEDLSLLARLYARLRDREQLIALIFEVGNASLSPDLEGSPGGCELMCFRDCIRATRRTYSRISSRSSMRPSHRCTGQRALPIRLEISRTL